MFIIKVAHFALIVSMFGKSHTSTLCKYMSTHCTNVAKIKCHNLQGYRIADEPASVNPNV